MNVGQSHKHKTMCFDAVYNVKYITTKLAYILKSIEKRIFKSKDLKTEKGFENNTIIVSM